MDLNITKVKKPTELGFSWITVTIFSIIVSIIPIIIISQKSKSVNKDNTDKLIKLAPILFGIVGFFLYHVFNKLNITNYYLFGFLFGLIISSTGRFIGHIPQTALNINPNLFSLMGTLLWTIVFGFGLGLINNINIYYED